MDEAISISAMQIKNVTLALLRSWFYVSSPAMRMEKALLWRVDNAFFSSFQGRFGTPFQKRVGAETPCWLFCLHLPDSGRLPNSGRSASAELLCAFQYMCRTCFNTHVGHVSIHL
jgi:hypothetical protein